LNYLTSKSQVLYIYAKNVFNEIIITILNQENIWIPYFIVTFLPLEQQFLDLNLNWFSQSKVQTCDNP